MRPLISIVIPIYNVEKYLKRCIKSVISQTYSNLEIFLVDDGSTDKSGEICDEYAKIDKRINVIHKKYGGVSNARNVALNLFSGDYIAFVDSDDFVACDFIEYLYGLICYAQGDISFAGEQSIANEVQIKDSNQKEKIILYAEDAIKKMLCDKGCSHNVWGKLYERKLWLHNRFTEGIIYEDYDVIYKVFSDSLITVYGEAKKYYYCIRDNSIMTMKLNEKTFDLLRISNKVTYYLINRYDDIEIEAFRLNIVTHCKVLKNILDDGFDKYNDTQKKIIRHIKINGKRLLFSNKVEFKDKIKIIAIFCNKFLFYSLYKMGDMKNGIKKGNQR